MLDESNNFPNQMDFFDEIGVDRSNVIPFPVQGNTDSNSIDQMEPLQYNEYEGNQQTVKRNADGSYTEINYTEKSDAEDLVDFVTGFKESVSGNSDEKAKDYVFAKIKETPKKKRRFRISMLFINPVMGLVCAFSAPLWWLGVLIDHSEYWLFYLVAAVISTIIGFLGVRNLIYIVRKMKNIYEAVKKREEQGIVSGESAKIVQSVRGIITWIVISMILGAFMYTLGDLFFDFEQMLCIMLIIFIVTIVRIVWFVKELIHMYNM